MVRNRELSRSVQEIMACARVRYLELEPEVDNTDDYNSSSSGMSQGDLLYPVRQRRKREQSDRDLYDMNREVLSIHDYSSF